MLILIQFLYMQKLIQFLIILLIFITDYPADYLCNFRGWYSSMNINTTDKVVTSTEQLEILENNRTIVFGGSVSDFVLPKVFNGKDIIGIKSEAFINLSNVEDVKELDISF